MYTLLFYNLNPHIFMEFLTIHLIMINIQTNINKYLYRPAISISKDH